jgi:ankyrin repeat protein
MFNLEKWKKIRRSSLVMVAFLLVLFNLAYASDNLGESLTEEVYNGNLEMVQLLLKNGVDQNQKDKDGKTALDIAKEEMATNVVKLLIELK